MPAQFPETGLARLALSTRLRDLSDEFRKAVAETDEPTGDGGTSGSGSALAERLWRLLDSDVPALQDALVVYLRAHDIPWVWIAERTGSSEAEVRARWAEIGPEPTADPQTAAELDAWYVRHAHVEPLAHVADPVSRLLGGDASQQERCLICAKYAGEPVPAWAGHPVPPGGHLIDDATWRVGHGPTGFWPRGTLLIESRRHFLDHTEMTTDEASSLGLLVRRLTDPIKEATGAPRVHVWSCMEGTPHFHTWLVPRVGEVRSGRAFIGDPGHCSDAEAEETVQAIRKALDSLETAEAEA